MADRVCENPACANPLPDGMRADARYCNDNCGRAHRRLRAETRRGRRRRIWVRGHWRALPPKTARST